MLATIWNDLRYSVRALGRNASESSRLRRAREHRCWVNGKIVATVRE
jgi:hypothetical protein